MPLALAAFIYRVRCMALILRLFPGTHLPNAKRQDFRALDCSRFGS